MNKAIVNGKFIVNDQVIEDKVLIFNNHILDISNKIPKDCEIIDANGDYVSPGFIDIHIHGLAGADVMDGTYEALNTISKNLLKSGTTSFLATTMTMSNESIDNALKNVCDNSHKVMGANILGIHLEGPFINHMKVGAQNIEYIQKANFELIEQYIDSIKIITLAPEVEGSNEFIKFMKLNYPEVILSIGHSNATYNECCDSIELGVSHATHLFNAMSAYHHRDPGIVGSIFDNEDTTCDVIADLIHLHPSALNMVFKNKKHNLMTITDSMRAGCMKNGSYDLGGQKVEVKDGKATLSNGQLAGSVLSMNQGVKNMFEHTDMTLVEAVQSVTNVPAKKLNLNKGALKIGYDADIVIFDKDFNIKQTIVNGVLKYA